MNENDKILDFILGDLDNEGETQLFASLAFDEELRDEMKTLMKIKSNIGSNLSKYVEPVSVKADIFKTLGYTFPGKINKEPATDCKQRKPKGPVFSIIFSCLLSVAGTYFFLKTVESDKQFIYFKNFPVFSKIEKNISNSLEKERNRQIYNNNSYTHIKKKSNRLMPLATSHKEESRVIDKPQTIEPDGNVLKKAAIYNLKPNPIALDKKIIREYFGIGPIIPNFGQELQADNSPEFSFEIRSAESWSLPNETIKPSNKNALNNFSFTSLYNLSNKLSLGPDIRQETYYVEYTGNESGSMYNYYQQPNLTTFGLALRYMPVEFGNIYPFAQLTAGVNKAGYTGRVMGGAEVRMTDNIGLILGIEYNLFLFSHERKIFDAQKINLNYGVIIRY